MIPQSRPFAAVSGTVSALASSLIIFLIFRSKKKLSCIYHRIMFGMSCADILRSVAIVLMVVIPLPNVNASTPGDEEDYDRGVTDMGNSLRICQAKVFFVRFGTISMFGYNGMLCCYYACSIAFRMKERKIKKRVEPFLHAFALLPALVASTTSLFSNQLVSTSDESIWCNITYVYIHQPNLLLGMLGIFAIVVITSFALIIRRTRKVDRELSSTGERRPSSTQTQDTQNLNTTIPRSTSQDNLHQIVESHKTTKIVIKQALAYIIALIISLIFPTIQLANGNGLAWADYLEAIFFPLQGFFNCIIFIGHKAYNYKRIHETLPYSVIIRNLFFDSEFDQDPILFTRISLVERMGSRHFVVNIFDEENGHEQTFYTTRMRRVVEHLHLEDHRIDECDDHITSGPAGSDGIHDSDCGSNLSSGPAGSNGINDHSNCRSNLSGFDQSIDVIMSMTGLSKPQSSNEDVNGIIVCQSAADTTTI